jgi:hypothetical protein
VSFSGKSRLPSSEGVILRIVSYLETDLRFYEIQQVSPLTTNPHKKPQTKMLLKWEQIGMISPVLVA